MNGINYQIKTGRRKTAQRKKKEKKNKQTKTKTKTKTKNQKQRKISGQERYFKNLSSSYKVTAIKSSAAETILLSSKYKNTAQG